jgi:hypothetical protein
MASDAACIVASYSFPPIGGESGVLVLWEGSEGSVSFRDSGKCWVSILWEGKPPGGKK